MIKSILIGAFLLLVLVSGYFVLSSPSAQDFFGEIFTRLTNRNLADVGSVFNDSFTEGGILSEAGSMRDSESSDWWVNSGGYLYSNPELSGTIQGSLPSSDRWFKEYASSNPEDTDNGEHPQNIFRLVSRTLWQNFSQEAYFKITAHNKSESENRNQSNGLLLFNRYADGNNLYYTGVRVDGDLVIKKKQAGKYTTLAQEEIFPGDYDANDNPNLIPVGEWIGLKSVVTTDEDGVVSIKLYTDVGKTGTWTLGLETTDDGRAHGEIIGEAGSAGIRTDFMDVLFSDYSITEVDPSAPGGGGTNGDVVIPSTMNLRVSVTNDNGGTLTPEDFSFLVGESVLGTDGDALSFSAGNYTIESLNQEYTAIFTGDCDGGNFTFSYGEDKTCLIAMDDIQREEPAPTDESNDETIETNGGGSSGDGNTTTGSTTGETTTGGDESSGGSSGTTTGGSSGGSSDSGGGTQGIGNGGGAGGSGTSISTSSEGDESVSSGGGGQDYSLDEHLSEDDTIVTNTGTASVQDSSDTDVLTEDSTKTPTVKEIIDDLLDSDQNKNEDTDTQKNTSEITISNTLPLLDFLPKVFLPGPDGEKITSLEPDKVLSVVISPVETPSLYYGVRTNEVKVLQAFLAQDKSIYPEGYVTGFYGPLTTEAVKRFQKKYNIVTNGNAVSTGYGVVGPLTTIKINQIYQSLKNVSSPLFDFRHTP